MLDKVNLLSIELIPDKDLFIPKFRNQKEEWDYFQRYYHRDMEERLLNSTLTTQEKLNMKRRLKRKEKSASICKFQILN